MSKIRESILIAAERAIGQSAIRYRHPGTGLSPDTGFDCSGFVVHTVQTAAQLHSISMVVPRHANEQWRNFGEYTSFHQRIPGDLVYFPSRKKAGLRIIGHVGIIASATTYVHSPGKDNTCIEEVALPDEPELLDDIHVRDLYTHSPAGIKRLSLPLGGGRWHVL